MEEIKIPDNLKNENFRFVLVKSKEKKAFEKEWQKKGYKYDDKKLLEHLEKGGNYGVICGYGNLICIDCDTQELIDTIESSLHETLTVARTPERRHYYFICRNFNTKLVLQKEGEH